MNVASSFLRAAMCGWLVVSVLCLAQAAPVTPAPAAPAPVAPPAPPSLKDAEGRTLRRAPTGHLTNYYEDKVGAYTLPDPLVLADGRPVRDADMWLRQRRPEILKLYETEIYGRVPATAPKVKWEVTKTEATALDGTAIRKEIALRFGGQPNGPVVHLHLYLPTKATGPVPVVLHVVFRGNVEPVSATPTLAVAPLMDTATPKALGDGGPIADILARGYAYATFRYTEIQPDNAAGFTQGVIGLALAPGQKKPAPGEWGTISAWTWGLSRIMDYLETDSSVDAKRVALVGHSRLGKTVLWAGATDSRYALIYSSQSGEMGAALSRRDFGETVDDMAANYGYQFAGNLQKYVAHWNDLPHEGHLLISLNAPRPVFISGGSGDQWSDPHGMFLATVAAGPVWRLFGQTDLGTTERPPLDTPVMFGSLGYLEHNGPHAITPLDWMAFLSFADRFLKPAK